MCHWIEDEVSAKYNITHGLGLAIILPHYLDYCLNEKSAYIYKELAVNVFGLDADMDDIEAGKKVIEILKDLFFNVCGLKPKLTDYVDMDNTYLDEMARIACRDGVVHGFVDMSQEDAKNILKLSM